MKKLEVKNLKKYYGDLHAVEDVSFSVEAGSVTALCGKNGSGKSTSIKCVLNILKTDGGTIKEDGKDWLWEPSRIGYLPEERGLFVKNAVYDQLMFLGNLKLKDKEKTKKAIDYWLGRFQIEKYRKSVLGTLSKGNMQKVQMIAAIMHEPELLVLDEPFSGLDPVNQKLFKAVLSELKESGMCILISSHHLEMVGELCENICIINNGRTLFSGSVIDLERTYGRDNIYFTTKDDVSYIKDAFMYAPCRYRIPIDGNEDFKKRFMDILDGRAEIDEIGKHKTDIQEIFIMLTEDKKSEGVVA